MDQFVAARRFCIGLVENGAASVVDDPAIGEHGAVAAIRLYRRLFPVHSVVRNGCVHGLPPAVGVAAVPDPAGAVVDLQDADGKEGAGLGVDALSDDRAVVFLGSVKATFESLHIGDYIIVDEGLNSVCNGKRRHRLDEG